MGGTKNMGYESRVEFGMKVWEGSTENHDLPNKNCGFL